jgi:DNA-binding LacI/PurR family transcriptional regulator
LSRHAAGVLLAAGHRRITLLSESDLKAGDLESHRGFAEATMLDARHPNLRANVVRFADNVTAMIQHLDALLRERERPTALVLPNSIYCLTVWSHLGARGIRIPRDMSVVAHLGTSDLAYLTPEPAHYRLNVTLYVQRILRAILARVSGGEMRQESPLLPDFIRGGSIAGPA